MNRLSVAQLKAVTQDAIDLCSSPGTCSACLADAAWNAALVKVRGEVEELPSVASGLGHAIEGGRMVERDRVLRILRGES